MASDSASGVNVRNADDTLRALRAFDTDASKAVEKGLRKAIRPIVQAAQSDVPIEPLSQWAKYGWIERRSGRNARIRERDLGWDAARVKRGIGGLLGGKRTRGRITSNLAGIKSANAAGAIYELAGAKTDTAFSRALEQSGSGPPKRLILRQDTPENRRRVERDITAAMREAEKVLQRHLDRME